MKNLFLSTFFFNMYHCVLWNLKNKCTFATSYSNLNFFLFATLFQCDSYFHQEWENLAMVMVVMTLLERKHTFSSLSNDELIFLLYPLLQSNTYFVFYFTNLVDTKIYINNNPFSNFSQNTNTAWEIN